MTQSLVTIIAPLPMQHLDRARTLIDELGNPAGEPLKSLLDGMASAPDSPALHFASLNAFAGPANRAHLVFEFSGDGEERQLLGALAQAIGAQVVPLFALASDRGDSDLVDYWRSHVVRVGQGYFSVPGLCFSGTPEMSVHRIRGERALYARLTRMVAPDPRARPTAQSELEYVRGAIAATDFRWALTPEATATLGPDRPLGLGVYLRIGASFAATYLWPLPALLLAVALAVPMIFLVRHASPGLPALGSLALKAAAITGFVAIAVLLPVLVLAYRSLRRQEDSDAVETRRTDPTLVASIMERENRAAQNHLAALFVMKPGWLRKLTIRLAFKLIGELGSRAFRPGFLGTLGTIHFARWVMVPRTGDLLFLSNYGGSWESYLEDFITRAHNGLTGVWSNTIGFPRSQNLFQLGATDGSRFKNWARRWQIPTGFWYSAYPDLTTSAVRRNAAVRQGLALALTEDEARAWLSLFGSQPRPDTALEVNEIQSLTFGGLGFLGFGRCIAFRFGNDPQRVRQWLAEVQPLVSFGDGRKLRDDQAVTLGLARSGLEGLGLPADGVAEFPQPFLDGMTAEWRSRALGDVDGNAPEHWWWGGPKGAPIDGVLLLNAAKDTCLTCLSDDMLTRLKKFDHTVVAEVDFEPHSGDKATPEEKRKSRAEPFGFADGISQPVIRGTYKALRSADPIHIVEPGEIILGYPDNRGYISPTPTLDPMSDPEGALPVASPPTAGFSRPLINEPRDLGRNGTFLVIRQLEQEIDRFKQYCETETTNLRARFPDWFVPGDFIAAKLVGRWPDGSSLVRYPYAPASDTSARSPALSTTARPLSRTAAGPSAATGAPATAMPPPIVPARRTKGGTPANPLKPPEPPEPDNDFLFGAEDPQGLRCPYGAHIRRANPRESGDPGSTEQLSITNRHRILRVGRKYTPRDGQKPGLFFMCLNADIERQFEFVQQTWLENQSFHGLTAETDPLVGGRRDKDGFTLPTRSGPVRLTLPDFVHTRGGGYFFLPSRSLLRFLTS